MCKSCEDVEKRKLSPRELFRASFYKLMRTYGEQSSKKGLTEVYDYLKTPAKLTDKMIEMTSKIIANRYKLNLSKVKQKHNDLLKAYYKSQRYRYKIKKADPAYVSYELAMIDIKSITAMQVGNLLWFAEHANTNFISQFIAEIMTANVEAGLSGYEIAGVLKSKFAEYTPREFARMFGEDKYWQLVTNNNVRNVASTANINSMVQANITQYRWVTRESERTCPICNALHGRVYEVSDARSQIDKYEQSAFNGDIDGMAKAGQFLDLKDVSNIDAFNGLFPPVHHNCECDIETV